MPPPDYVTKRNDTQAIAATLQEGGAAVDLTNASVRFHMEDEAGTVVVDAAAVVVNGPTGQVRYDPSAGDVDTAGLFKVEWEVTYGDGSIETFPADDFLDWRIRRDIA